MSTTTKTPAAKATATKTSATDHLQEALRNVEQAREVAQGDVRDQLDQAADRLRAAADDLRERAGDEIREIEESLDRASDHLIVELGLRSVRAQRSADALTKMSAEIRKRRAELAGAGR